MNIAEIEQQVKNVLLNSNQQNFLFDLLLAYGKPKASINRLQTNGSSSYNLSKEPGVVLWKSNVCFVPTTSLDLDSIVDEYRERPAVVKHKPRFIFATNFDRVCAYDTQTEEHLDVPFLELPSQFAFFLPWAGMEKAKIKEDSPADIKAAEKMAKLYDLILSDNPKSFNQDSHSLNVFLSRVLFCYFAEDTEIFSPKLFSKSIESHTAKDGSDLSAYLQELFRVLNVESRKTVPAYLKEFPYVNGGLFAEHHEIPNFSKRSRQLLIDCGLELDWSEISPDIFGSMFQAVVDVEQRGSMGMHYTSVTNIMKVIEPLFLDEFHAEFEKAKGSQKRLLDLQKRLTTLKVFDPACGSGNFLIIAYKELRRLEMEILNQLSLINGQADFGLTGIQLSQFYGIEIDDFAHEIAILSLWLAEHQMNLAFMKKFGKGTPTLPLKPGGTVVCGNAARENWLKLVSAKPSTEVFVVGNPPYLGARLQSVEQKADMDHVFGDTTAHSNLDYIAMWFFKAAQLVNAAPFAVKSAFVSTNSISQGEQTSLIWPHVFELGVEIAFVHQNFKWENSAKNNATVMCVIIGLGKSSQAPKRIYSEGLVRPAKNIGPYLVEGSNDVIYKRKKPISNFPAVVFGSMPNDGGHLLLDDGEKASLIAKNPGLSKFIRATVGSHDFLHGQERWCFWLDGKDYSHEPEIVKRVEATRKHRLSSDRASTKALADQPHLFGEVRHRSGPSIIIPAHSSERRRYIPMGYLTRSEIINNSAFAVYDADLFLFGVLSSAMHTLWVRAIGGQLETRLRYSAALCYNTFPIPTPLAAKHKEISNAALGIIACREAHSDQTLAELYDPDDGAPELIEAHLKLDRHVESIYQSTPFKSDEERLAALFKWNKKMTEATDA
ncbi:MAG: class I SAM-dependent DNA methyltransferase [Burkholderiales bacterium]|nr:class I SAM-dependent DNA methyltransferase [Burkholderiales bacterium]